MATSFDFGIESSFPQIKKGGYRITSPASRSYNCIAWAAENDNLWWWPDSLMTSYWPSDIPREVTLEAFIKLFEQFGNRLIALMKTPCV